MTRGIDTFIYSGSLIILVIKKMAQLDQEDIKFLEDLAAELKKHDGVYDPEAEELENIVFRAKQVEGE